ncbi:MAG: hypothetical protein V9G19_19585 [Tetrasphaera sp.]
MASRPGPPAALTDAPRAARFLWLLTHRRFERRERATFGPQSTLLPRSGGRTW